MIFIDQIGHQIVLDTIPKRIVSVVPSQTELLFDLGLDVEVVGITKFCVHPQKWFKIKKRIGGTKTIDIQKVKVLNPDLIIANKEENTKEQILELQKLFPVWTSDISNLTESLEMIEQIGKITNTLSKAIELIEKINVDFTQLSSLAFKQKNTLYFIWRKPYMTVGKTTFIHDMMMRSGYKNLVDVNENYPVLELEEINKHQPELILLSSEPFPFKKNHIKEFQNVCPNAQIELVDGEMFSWYGSRLTKSVNYLIDLYSKIN